MLSSFALFALFALGASATPVEVGSDALRERAPPVCCVGRCSGCGEKRVRAASQLLDPET
ncbi:hypothetical protein E4U21_006382 [Claviceps maximensis]|nr:hypothetical protein E4U21_006382 [Claviceps maximensis]